MSVKYLKAYTYKQAKKIMDEYKDVPLSEIRKAKEV